MDKPVVSKKVSKGKTVKLSWKKVDGAKSYWVWKCNKTGSSCTGIKELKSKTTSYTIKNLKQGKIYYYKIEAESVLKKKSSITSSSDVIIVRAKPKTPSLKLSKKSFNSVNIKVGNAGSATYYEIYRSNNKKKGYKKVQTISNYGDYIDSTVLPSKTYYYKVRACNENACGSYSKIKSIKPTLGTPSMSITKNESKQAVIKYNSVVGATGYEIYRSTKEKKGYKLISDIKDTNYIDETVVNKKYYYKVRAYIIINGKKYYSSYSKIKSIKIS